MTRPEGEDPSVPVGPPPAPASGEKPVPVRAPETRSVQRRSHVALVLLTLAAGAMDAIAFLGLGGVFTANMTGNLILFALAGREDWVLHALRSGLACAGFCAGLLIGFTMPGRHGGNALWSPAAVRLLWAGLALQIAFLAGWAISGGAPGPVVILALIGAGSCAMGMQAAAARRVDLAGITATFVTGTLTALFETSGPGWSTDNRRRTAIVVALVLGALCASLLLRFAPPWAGVAAPVFTLLALAVVHPYAHLGRRGRPGRARG
ncbi:YoaK family protein [Streptosporangium sp. NPDC002524]|uniref:YoaK family protein n=1 Tax=Streptosporangium sp. NPDC002524 TaxID=3154537 RepID=UPI003321850C